MDPTALITAIEAEAAGLAAAAAAATDLEAPQGRLEVLGDPSVAEPWTQTARF